MVGEWGNFWKLGEMGQAWREYGRSGEMWGRNGEVCWGVGEVRGGVGDVGKYGRGVVECMG